MMSAESVAFGELVRAAVNYTRLWCQTCNCEQAHDKAILSISFASWTGTERHEFWRCIRCGNVQNWKMP